ncbi:haemagglutination activity domain protein [Coleofasciculus chthonoplastes PCC 7420]|uniref:Haemagglutination activity domain protein n=1 Tax=Coleofasciculus chthonoplastes PCC 7420 TaxID=118168 RepID=B4W0I1_9CYAN|nr:haemagglutination activity domain protein [Coleofasciculus chthonoplastes PCC 7420]
MGLTKERWHLTKLLTWLTENSKVNSILLWTLVLGFFPTGVEAQPVPANDGTNTQVDASGDKFTITGGQTSGDGANLFHNFSEFGLDANQTANFISNPTIQNILSRVTGGNASLINGLIQVTGGNSNLFLMNPAGIVFGQNARLDVPASFTATTATGIGFGENWFSAIASNDYTSLVGQPNAFTFNTSNPGAIVNGGNLEVGKDLNFVGGTVVSTGNLEAPKGQITITTVPGESTVRLSQPGHLLSLEVPAGDAPINPLSLPELLTGSVDVPDVGVNSNGTVKLSASGIPIEPGDIVAKNVIAETATLYARHNLTLVESQLQTTGDLNLLAQDTVRVRDSVTHSFLAQAGGNLYIQGNNTIDILALNHPQTPFQSGGNLSLVSDGDISGDAHFTSGGHFSILNLVGNPGNFVSYFDPIISVDGDVTFGDYNGVALKIEATGSITGGNITITGPDTMLTGDDPDIEILTSSPSVILRAGLTALNNPVNVSPSTPFLDVNSNTTFNSTETSASLGNITVNNIDTSSNDSAYDSGKVILSATGNITVNGNIDTSNQVDSNSGDINILASSGDISLENISSSSNQFGDAGSINVLASSGSITVNGNINTANTLSGNSGNSGDVDLTAADEIITRNIDMRNQGNGELGTVSLRAGGSITTGNITPEEELMNQGRLIITENTPITDPETPPFTDPRTDPIPDPGTDPETPPFTDPETDPPINLVDIIPPDLDEDADWQIDPDQLISEGEEESPIITYERSPFRPEDNPSETNSLNPEDNTSETNSLNPEDNTSETNSLNPEDNLNNSSDTTLSEPTNQLTNSSNPSPSETSSNPSVSAETPSSEANSNPSTPANNSSSETSSSGNSESSLQSVDASEENFTRQFVDYLGLPTDIPLVTLAKSRDILSNIEKTTGVKPALLYISFVPPDSSNQAENSSSSNQNIPRKTRNPQDQLELLLVTANGLPIRKRIPEITRQQVLNVADQFRLEVTNIRSRQGYIAPGKRLYDWLVAPMDNELQALGIENITFLVDYGLRSIPLAALYDGQQFLIEKYSVGLMPSLSLVNPNYAPIENMEVLAMGAAEFTDQKPLPAVPVELSAITQSLWQGKSFLNDTFTLENLKAQRQQQPFGIIHLATHANFQSGEPNNSYIQLWDRKLRLNQLPQLDWNNPPVELLVLSACRTALGNEEAELGFAGLAVQAGAKSAVGSLWYVSDEGTLGLMTQLYQTLKQAPIKAEALQQTQLAMLQGQVYVQGGQLIAGNKSVPLPPELARLGDGNFQHPYYWSAFTMVGSPW